MCCLFTILVFLGPRIGGIFWWLFQPARWDLAFGSIIWPILGLIFLPWTTIMYVAVAGGPGGIEGILEWGLLIFAAIMDIGAYTGGGYGNRNRLGYSG